MEEKNDATDAMIANGKHDEMLPDHQSVKPRFHIKIKLFLNNFSPEPPPSVDRPIFLIFQAWFHHEMK